MSADLLAQLQAFAQAHGGKLRTGPQARKPESCPQAPCEGCPQALTGGSALAPSRAQVCAHAPAGTRESAREAHAGSPPCIGRTQPVQKPQNRDPWLDYTDDYSLWKQGQ